MRAQTPEAKTKRLFEEYTGTFDGIDSIAEKKYYRNPPARVRKYLEGRGEAHKQQLKKEYLEIAVGGRRAEWLKERHAVRSVVDCL